MKSDCSKTLVGWYYNKMTNEKGCYRAYKSDSR